MSSADRAAPTWAEVAGRLGLQVLRGRVPDSLTGARHPRPAFWIEDDRILVRYPDQWAMMVEAGSTVTVEWPNDDEPSWVIDRWAAPMAMLQRGSLCLHAVALRFGDVAIAFAGHSGAGKSTTALALAERGHELLCDDVCIVEIQADQAFLRPFLTDVHVLPDAAEMLDIDVSMLPEIVAGRGKYAVRPEQPSVTRLPLAAIVCLGPTDTAEVELEKAQGARRLAALTRAFQGSRLATSVLGPRRMFERLSEIAATTPVYELRRPRDEWSLEAVLEAVDTVVRDMS